ncbi:type II secretion system protein GspE [Prosthecomicrobium hirschii]|nr:type II secretion system protein GspE [Prosthecomicrobium hirschii]
MVQLGLMSEDAMRGLAAAERGIVPIAPDAFPTEPLFEDLLPIAFLRQARLLPLHDGPNMVQLAIADPFDNFSPSLVAAKLGKPVRLRLAKKRDIEQAIDDLYGGKETAPGQTLESELSATDLDRLRDLAGDAPTVQFVDRMIDSAIELGASDIHLSHTARGPRLRYRVDGLLREGGAPPESLYSGTVSRLKIMAGLDIAERRLPQDGHIAVVSRGRAADLRVATTPHVHGEGVVLRLLDRGPVTTDFAALGLGSATRAALEQALKAPNGLILVTGPTGSGKTTTLYAALATLRGEERNIVSIEDPVERHVEGVNQIQVARKVGIGFAEALRSVLRQDPDVIMVGEIRDRETAAVAIQAALTGHLVLATLHTNTAAGALIRLVDMGVEPFLLSSTVLASFAQRLVRRTCPTCAGAGCSSCGGTGFRGRIAVSEGFAMDGTLRDALRSGVGEKELQAAVSAAGMIDLQGDADEKVRHGETTRAEVERVLGVRSI